MSEIAALPYRRVFVNTGDPIEETDLVEFRLLYSGELLAASREDTRAAHKHEIRRTFHPQLRRLWNLENNLRKLAQLYWGRSLKGKKNYAIPSEQEIFEQGIRSFSENWGRNGFKFVPLVTDEMALRCSLDILLLRPQEKRFIFTQGDIDGQVKTLFDALRIPKNFAEAGGIGPQQDETPFFCLLEDDRLVTEVRVLADQLLLLPSQRDCKATDSFVIIDVKLNHRNPRTRDNYFG